MRDGFCTSMEEEGENDEGESGDARDLIEWLDVENKTLGATPATDTGDHELSLHTFGVFMAAGAAAGLGVAATALTCVVVAKRERRGVGRVTLRSNPHLCYLILTRLSFHLE